MSSFGGSAFNLAHLGGPDITIYAGFLSVIVNVLVVGAATAIARAAGLEDGVDATAVADYHVDRA